MINIINTILNFIFNILLYPFTNLNPFWAILFISVLTGIIMLTIFKKVSNQIKILQTKNTIKAYLLELRLYNDTVRHSLSAVVNLFSANLKYIVQVIKPLFFLFIPVSFILIQVGSRFGYRSLHQGEHTIVSATVKDNIPIHQVTLSASDGSEIEIKPVRIPHEYKIYWRLKALKKGIWHIKCNYDSISINKKIVIDKNTTLLANARTGKYSLTAFLNPGEKTLRQNKFLKEIHIHYPQETIHIAGLQVHWLVLFFILSIVSGFAFKGFLGVEI